METIKMCEYSSTEGTYSIPFIESETDNRFSFLISTFFKHYYDPIKIICNEGESSLKEFGFSMHHVENIHGYELKGIFVGIYKVGVNKPVWHRVIEDEAGYRKEMSFSLDDVELPCGRYFMLFGNITPDKEFVHFTKDFAGCWRLDFAIIPNGLPLKHPLLLDFKIRYITPEERELSYPYHYPNYLMMIGDFPLYELEVTLDVIPDKYMDKFDLRIFDEGLSCMETIEDIIHQPTERISFVPPHGVPHGTGHYILYHNEIPFVHLWCNRKKRMGALKAEPISKDSIYWYLHRCKSLQLYGRIKKDILAVLNCPEKSSPQCLCIMDERGRSVNVIPNILEDLYAGMSHRYLFDNYYGEDTMTESDIWIWDLCKSSESLWGKWTVYIEKYVQNGCKNLIIFGTQQEVCALFEQFEVMLQLVPKKNCWQIQPFTKMEKLYLMIDEKMGDGDNPNFERFEKMYEEVNA